MDLAQRLRDTLRFACAAVRDAQSGGDVWQEPIGNHMVLADKVPVEAALLLMLAARAGHGSGELAGVLDPAIRSERSRELLARFPSTASMFGMGHAALAAAGRGDDGFDALLRGIFRAGFAHRRPLEVAWIREKLFGAESDWTHAVTADADPMAMTTRDVYALTHAIMYATDFGRRAAAPAEALVDSCIAERLVAEDLDLLAELLLCAIMLGGTWSPHARSAWRVLDGVWREFGFLPTTTVRTGHALRDTYHTTFMGGNLFALLLQRPQDVDAGPRGEPLPAELAAFGETSRYLGADDVATVTEGLRIRLIRKTASAPTPATPDRR